MREQRNLSLAYMLRARRRARAQIRCYAHVGNGEINVSRLRRAVDAYLNSRINRALAFAKAGHGPVNMRRVNQIRNTISREEKWQEAIKTISKSVEWHLVPKSVTGFRKVCQLPVEAKAWSYLASDLIASTFEPHQHIADWPHRGRDWQVRQIHSTLNSSNLRVVLADVTNAFDAVNSKVLYDLLDLPKELIRGALDARRYDFVHDVRKSRIEARRVCNPYSDIPLDGTAPRGLLQGAPSSNLTFAILLNDLPDHLPENLGCFVYCDNILVVVENDKDAQEIRNALVEYFARHRAGPFSITHEVSKVTGFGFEHLGYNFRWDDREMSIGLSAKNWVRFRRSLEKPQISRPNGFEYVKTGFVECTWDMLNVYAIEAIEGRCANL